MPQEPPSQSLSQNTSSNSTDNVIGPSAYFGDGQVGGSGSTQSH